MIRKKRIYQLLLLPLLLLLLTPAMAQQDDDQEMRNEDLLIDKAHDRVLKLNLLRMGAVQVSYEKMRSERISNEIALGYVYRGYFKGDSFFSPDKVNADGVEVRMSQRYYTSKKYSGTPFGFFHGPVFGYRFMVFEENVFNLPERNPQDPDYRFVGRLYQNTLELAYQAGGQFKLGRNFTAEVSAILGGRLQYVLAKGANELLTDNIRGYDLVAEENSAILLDPTPQLNISVGYSF
ncbi:hypothetical protein [Pontibacter akesuensis]|uniref:Outer membrane protein beta-barrel domain-containing protein n=1 Tax=Pontibacter akesuensis TaxID=388950 RepID=A0A1I7HTS4_9BACT|nr:hypothetical protein [Pontibacter akesuensis]SFU63896.1 hypothetical protein SAMN04487941_1657 [Pontibacter akesuensis]